jgi:hypothetical protein
MNRVFIVAGDERLDLQRAGGATVYRPRAWLGCGTMA